MKKPLYNKPFGKPTRDFKKYIESWRSLAEPICKLTGAKLFAFSNKVMLVFDDELITVPPSFLRKLNRSLDKEKRSKK